MTVKLCVKKLDTKILIYLKFSFLLICIFFLKIVLIDQNTVINIVFLRGKRPGTIMCFEAVCIVLIMHIVRDQHIWDVFEVWRTMNE